MDWIFVFIILLALVIYFLDAWHKNVKNGETVESFTNNFNNRSYKYNFNRMSGKVAGGYSGLTNIYNKSPYFKNFSKFGSTPPLPSCNITKLSTDCTNYDEDTSLDKFMPVCQKSTSVYPYGDGDFKIPLFAMGRTIGRPRECRLMYEPKK